jgi:uncharacterized protein YgiB involved in biofilm formation
MNKPKGVRRRSQKVHTVLLTASVATLLGGCEPDRFESQADCEKAKGAGNCHVAPTPVKMTEANRPSYEKKDACETDFGEERCEEQKRAGRAIYRPYFYPGTHFYVPGSGFTGYYNDSPHAHFDSKVAAAKPYSVRPSASLRGPTGTITRGGFGAKGGGTCC